MQRAARAQRSGTAMAMPLPRVNRILTRVRSPGPLTSRPGAALTGVSTPAYTRTAGCTHRAAGATVEAYFTSSAAASLTGPRFPSPFSPSPYTLHAFKFHATVMPKPCAHRLGRVSARNHRKAKRQEQQTASDCSDTGEWGAADLGGPWRGSDERGGYISGGRVGESQRPAQGGERQHVARAWI